MRGDARRHVDLVPRQDFARISQRTRIRDRRAGRNYREIVPRHV
jgi:hypothetical protein